METVTVNPFVALELAQREAEQQAHAAAEHAAYTRGVLDGLRLAREALQAAVQTAERARSTAPAPEHQEPTE